MKQYEIWQEGFHVQEGKASAQFVGTAEGVTFEEACVNYAEKDEAFANLFNADRLTYWGCSLYDNEADARRNFG